MDPPNSWTVIGCGDFWVLVRSLELQKMSMVDWLSMRIQVGRPSGGWRAHAGRPVNAAPCLRLGRVWIPAEVTATPP